MTTTDLAIDALAVSRLARLVTADTITRPLRAQVIRDAYIRADRPLEDGLSNVFVEQVAHDDHEAPAMAELIICQFCSSMYAAAFVVFARRFAPRWWDPLARVLAASLVTGMLASHAE